MAEGWFQLCVRDVPDRLGGLMQRIGLRQAKSGKVWFRNFNSSGKTSKAAARHLLDQLNRAGLTNRGWRKIQPPARQLHGKPKTRHPSERQLAVVRFHESKKEARLRRDASIQQTFRRPPAPGRQDPQPPRTTAADEMRQRNAARQLVRDFS